MDTPETSPDNGQDSDQDASPGQPQDVQADVQVDAQDAPELWLPLREAAPLLGLSVEAARKRAQRGTLRARKADDGWLIAMPAGLDAPLDNGQDPQRVVLDNNSNAGQDVHLDAGRTRPGHDQADDPEVLRSVQELIAAQRSEIAFLRSELEARTEEIRRRDHILAGVLQELSAIKALAPGAIIDAEEPAPETPKSAYGPESAQNGPGRTDPPEMGNETLQGGSVEPDQSQVPPATGWRRVWRRILGHEE